MMTDKTTEKCEARKSRYELIASLVARRLGYTIDEFGQSLDEITVDELLSAVCDIAGMLEDIVDALQQD